MKRRIKILDLKTLGILHKDYSGAWGIYHRDKDEIWLDKRLKDKPRPSFREVLLHEQGHRRIEKAGVQAYFNEKQEETFCDLWAILNYRKSNLSGLELTIREKLEAGGLKWQRTKDRETITKRMLKLSGVRVSYPVLTALS